MKPSESQIGLIFSWFSWIMPRQEAVDAANWAEHNITKYELSKEITRMHELKRRNNLTKESCFDSPAWAKYKENKNED